MKIIQKVASVAFLMGLFTVSLQLSADIKQSVEKMLKQRIELLDTQLHKTGITDAQKTALEEELKKFQDELEKTKKLGSEYIKPNTVTITNNSKEPIDVVFQAAGCAGISVGKTQVCKSSKKLGPGDSASYTWKRGQTDRKVLIKESGRKMPPFFLKPGEKVKKGKYSWQGFKQRGTIVKFGNEVPNVKPINSEDFIYVHDIK